MRQVRGLSWIPAAGPACSIAVAVLLTAGLTLSAPAKAAGTAVTVSNPWIRFIIRARPAAGYFTLNNSGNTPVQLIGAASPACGMLMLHQSQEVNGVEKMRPVKKVAVPAHGSVAFTPGHYHLMCMKPAATMARGKSVPVTLKFGNGTSLTADFPVRGAGDK